MAITQRDKLGTLASLASIERFIRAEIIHPEIERILLDAVMDARRVLSEQLQP